MLLLDGDQVRLVTPAPGQSPARTERLARQHPTANTTDARPDNTVKEDSRLSTPAPHPAPAQASLMQADRLGRRHGKAAAYGQIGDSSDAAAQPFYRDLLRGISRADQQITGLYQTPDLTARWDYDRDSLAADLALARDDPGMAKAADTYLAAAREEFWLEAARLARRRLQPGPDHRAGGGDQARRACPGRGRPGPKPKTRTRTRLQPRGRICGRTSPTRPPG
jgi:hypothetical protein